MPESRHSFDMSLEFEFTLDWLSIFEEGSTFFCLVFKKPVSIWRDLRGFLFVAHLSAARFCIYIRRKGYVHVASSRNFARLQGEEFSLNPWRRSHLRQSVIGCRPGNDAVAADGSMVTPRVSRPILGISKSGGGIQVVS